MIAGWEGEPGAGKPEDLPIMMMDGVAMAPFGTQMSECRMGLFCGTFVCRGIPWPALSRAQQATLLQKHVKNPGPEDLALVTSHRG